MAATAVCRDVPKMSKIACQAHGLSSGGEVVAVDGTFWPCRLRCEPAAELRTEPVEPAAELVAVSLRHVLQRQVGQTAPRQALQQVPGGALCEVPRIRPEGAALVPVVLVGEARQHRPAVLALQAGKIVPDDEGIRRVSDRIAGEDDLPRPDAVGPDREMLVEVDPMPDRSAHRGVVDEEGQRRVGDRVTDPDPPQMRLSAVALGEPESGQWIADD